MAYPIPLFSVISGTLAGYLGVDLFVKNKEVLYAKDKVTSYILFEFAVVLYVAILASIVYVLFTRYLGYPFPYILSKVLPITRPLRLVFIVCSACVVLLVPLLCMAFASSSMVGNDDGEIDKDEVMFYYRCITLVIIGMLSILVVFAFTQNI